MENAKQIYKSIKNYKNVEIFLILVIIGEVILIFLSKVKISEFITMLSSFGVLVAAYFSYRAIREMKKERYLSNLPDIRIVAIDSWAKKNNIDDYPNSGLDPYYYKVRYSNKGRGEAFVDKISIFFINQGTQKYQMKNVDNIQVSLLPGEEVDINDYGDGLEKKDTDLHYLLKKVVIDYRDKYGHKIHYTALVKNKVSEPTPYLGIEDFIDHKVVYPPELMG